MLIYVHNDPFAKSQQFVTIDTIDELVKLIRENNRMSMTIDDVDGIISIEGKKIFIEDIV